MRNAVDKRGRLEEEVFSYKITKDQRVFLYWHGKQVMVISGRSALDFIGKISDAEGRDAQLLMARVTGHFKHGNEKAGKWGVEN